MRVCLFFDGKNFYEGLERARPGNHRLDYGGLSRWLVERAGGSRLVGAHYYTGVPDRDDPAAAQLRGLTHFLDGLEFVEGFFVHRFGRSRRSARCSACGVDSAWYEEKEVDTSIAVDMLRLAHADAFDVMVLASGDADHAPAAEAVRDLGKEVWLANWGDAALAPRLRRAAYAHIDLLEECPRSILREAPKPRPEPKPADEASFLVELERAQRYFESNNGYLGRGYFLHRWRGHGLPTQPDEREAMLDELLEAGRIEEIEAEGGVGLRLPERAAARPAAEPEPREERQVPPAERPSDPPVNVVGDLEGLEGVDGMLNGVLCSIRRAEQHFEGTGFVGRGYFLTRWRDPALPADTQWRERMVDLLIVRGLAEQYNVQGSLALRTKPAT
ncbi:MAG: NYN domain-containing protein [Alphaproteobacteria bacterium]|nr:NYN domain-containing protein [Alphaproteobacteria bacterium]MCB9793006.1 NYN domain-containing protein [Alphaproteobacteria bacterium]